MVREPPVVAPNYAVEDRARRVLFVGTLFDDQTRRTDGACALSLTVSCEQPRDPIATRARVRAGRRLRATSDAASQNRSTSSTAGHVADSDPHTFCSSRSSSRRSVPTQCGSGPKWVPRGSPRAAAHAPAHAARCVQCLQQRLLALSRPFMQSGLPLIGVRGLVNEAALAFAASLYRALSPSVFRSTCADHAADGTGIGYAPQSESGSEAPDAYRRM